MWDLGVGGFVECRKLQLYESSSIEPENFLNWQLLEHLVLAILQLFKK